MFTDPRCSWRRIVSAPQHRRSNLVQSVVASQHTRLATADCGSILFVDLDSDPTFSLTCIWIILYNMLARTALEYRMCWCCIFVTSETVFV